MTKLPIQNIFSVFAVFVIALALTLQTLFVPSVSAAQITDRKLTLMAGDSGTFDGGSMPGGTVRHFFEFTIPTTGTAIGSVSFEYCTTAADVGTSTCQAPTGLSTAGVSLGSEVGSGATGFTASSPSGNVALLTKATAATPSNGDLKFQLDDIVNPSTEGTFFVRIATFNSIDGTGTAIDSGTVAASTAEQIIVEGIMPESLVFCTGGLVGKTASVPDCSTATAGDIEFNQLFSPTDTASAISQMAASTNAGFGYAITVNGPTLTSGSNTIAGLSTPNASVKGVAQFGLNLRANTIAAAPGFDPGADPDILTLSADIDLTSNGTSLKGHPTADYGTADTFAFASGDAIATSSYDGATNTTLGPSDAQIYTVSYIANVPGSQPAGTYTSTLTYICTPTF